MRRLIALTVAVCLNLLTVEVAYAESIAERDAESIVRTASAIVEAVVQKVTPVVEESGFVFNYITISVTETLKGEVPQEIIIRSLWSDTGRKEPYAFAPIFEPNEKLIVCLGQRRDGYYSTHGLLRSKYPIVGGNLKDKPVSTADFKSQIKELVDGLRSEITLDIPRPLVADHRTGEGHRHVLPASEDNDRAIRATKPNTNHTVHDFGPYFNGRNEYYNVTNLDIFYNPTNAPGGTSISNMETHIEAAIDSWNDVPNKTISLTYQDTTTVEGPNIAGNLNVIGWEDLGDPDILGVERPRPSMPPAYPDPPQVKTGSDIALNYESAWSFSATPPGSRAEPNDFDVRDVLIHELGHTLCLNHGSQATIMYGDYRNTQVPIRALSDADSAGVIHQNPSPSGTISHRNGYWAIKSITLTGDITIANGGELTAEDITVTLNGYSVKSTGGILRNVGYGPTWVPDIRLQSKSYNRYPTITAAINDANTTSGDTVMVKTSGTYSEYLVMRQKVHLKNASGGTVIVRNPNRSIAIAVLDTADNCSVEGVKFDDSVSWTVHIDGATGVTFKNCKIEAAGYYALAVSNTAATFDYVQVTNSSDTGAILTDSDSDFDNCLFHNNGNEGDDHGIHCTGTSTPDLGHETYSEADSFSTNSGRDIYANSTCDNINASYNRWDEDPPNVEHANQGKTIDTDPYDVLSKPTVPSDPNVAQAEQLKARGRMLVKEGQDEEALSCFQQVVDEYPRTDAARFALAHAASVYWRQRRFADAIGYLDKVAQQHPNIELGVKAEYLSLRHRAKLGDYKDALRRAEAIITLNPESPWVPYAMLRKGTIYLHKSNDPVMAAEVFGEIAKKYPDEPGMRNLALGYQAIAQERAGLPNEVAAKPSFVASKTGSLANFPNPFNPTTTVSFSLTEPVPVQLTIYNTVGQKIRTLIAETSMGAGIHQMVWDGKDDQGWPVSSGVYMYEMKAGDFQAVRKMIMLK